MAVSIAQVKQASIDAMKAGDVEKAKKYKALYVKYRRVFSTATAPSNRQCL